MARYIFLKPVHFRILPVLHFRGIDNGYSAKGTEKDMVEFMFDQTVLELGLVDKAMGERGL